MDGIVMGGGVGLSINSKVRISTNYSVFSMPGLYYRRFKLEVKLGLFTDVGSGYFFSRLKNNLGMFLALTGYRLRGADLYYSGLADFYVDRDDLP
jgi:3-hydroxyisobutyryl-CoA hydrolase